MAIAEPDPTIRRRVIAAGRRLIAADPDATIRSITSAAGVSRATFYRHFGTRAALLQELNVPPPSASRDRVLESAAEMLQRRPLALLAMEDLARSAGVSRASLYRMFPGKAALLRALVERYAPFEPLLAMLEARGDEPPEVLIPDLARELATSAGSRIGVVRALLMETITAPSESFAGIRPILLRVLETLGGYLGRHAAEGRLRPMHPLLATQAIIGPVVFHLLTRSVAERLVEIEMDPERAAGELAQVTLNGMLR